MEEKVLFSITETGDDISIQAQSTPMELAMAFSMVFQNSKEMRAIVEMALSAVDAGMVEDIEVTNNSQSIKTEGDA
jgi:hypothetical protein